MKLARSFVSLSAIIITSVPLAHGDGLPNPNNGGDINQEQSTNLAEGYKLELESAKGILIKVPAAANGELRSDAAEMRVVSEDTNSVIESDSVENVFATASDLASMPSLTSDQIEKADIAKDQSTWGFYYWSYYWTAPTYYYTYTPVYYYVTPVRYTYRTHYYVNNYYYFWYR